jgi:hypothetical protein
MSSAAKNMALKVVVADWDTPPPSPRNLPP